MWETIPDGHIFDLCRAPPPPLAYSRVHPRDFFRFFFWCQQMKPIGSKTGALATYKKTQKPRKRRSVSMYLETSRALIFGDLPKIQGT